MLMVFMIWIQTNSKKQKGYDLMDIVALKIIERSKIKTRILKSTTKNIEKAIKGGNVGTEIILPK